MSLRFGVSVSRVPDLRLPEVEDIRPGHDASDLPANPHEHGLALEEQHLQDPGALALVHDRERRAHEVPRGPDAVTPLRDIQRGGRAAMDDLEGEVETDDDSIAIQLGIE